MKKRKNLHTSFIKFLLEKYNDETQQLPDEETETPQNKNHLRKLYEIEDEEPTDDEPIENEPTDDEVETDDEIIDELLNEYRLLMKQKRQLKQTNERRFHTRLRRKK